MNKNQVQLLKEKAQSKGLAIKSAVVGGCFVACANANAALVQADVDAVVTDVLADLAIAVAAGFAIFGTAVAAKVGFSMLSRFIGKGARG
jgi:hypothetical protein